MLMYLEMLSKLIDAPRQDGDLHFWRSGISFVYTGILYNFRFFFECQYHVLFFTSSYEDGVRILYVRIIACTSLRV